MVSFRDLNKALRTLAIESNRPVLVHSSLSAFGQVAGGAETVLGALLGAFFTVVMPTFTYSTMVVPEIGPEHNGMQYGSARDANRMAEFFREDMPADRLMGRIPELLRNRPTATRSIHPILSFSGINAEGLLVQQTLEEPFLPVNAMKRERGWVLLLGVDQTVNSAIHYGEWAAGRKRFVRWALTTKGIVACGFPGCSQGFQSIEPHIRSITRQVPAGPAVIQAIPIPELTDTVVGLIEADPLALLCERPDCELCNTVRADVQRQEISNA